MTDADRSLRGVIFDMDGVLVDSLDAHLKSWECLSEELDLHVTRDQYAATFGMVSRDIIARLFGVTDEAQARRIDERKESIYRDLIRGNVPVMPGARTLVDALAAAGFRLGVGSSGPPENVEMVCEEMGLSPLLSGVVTGRDVQRGKPDPQVFLMTAERMRVSPSRCVVIEDAPVGIEAARRAGMKSVGLVGTHPAERLNGADWVVERLSEVTIPALTKLLA